MLKLFYWLRIQLKLFLRKYLLLYMFCKNCGRRVTDRYDFQCSDEIWKIVEPRIKYGYILCSPCFQQILNNVK